MGLAPLLVLFLLSTSGSPSVPAVALLAGGGGEEAVRPLFRAEPIRGFTHDSGATGARYIVETMGSGLAWVDFDRDGDLDLFLLDGGPIDPKERDARAPRSRLLEAGPGGTWADRTDDSGISIPDYGMGCAVGDVDGDGDDDLYVTCFGPDRLFLNEGGLKFRDATDEARLGDRGWGASAAFSDLDRDGDLDLVVTRYLDFTIATHRVCSLGREIPTYCSPSAYPGVVDLLYRNEGDGTFTEVGESAGLGKRVGKGLGVWIGDVDGDRSLDLYIANDGEENALFLGNGDLTFRDHSLASGAGYNEDGRAEAGMGIASGDVDGDGRVDLLVTHLSSETHTLYRGEGQGFFRDATTASGLSASTLVQTGFGAAFADFDRDGVLDLVVANGHVIDNIGEFGDLFTYRQQDDFFLGDGSRFRSPAGWLESELASGVGRGLAVGDADGDGDLDWLVSQVDGPAVLYRNLSSATERWLGIRLSEKGVGAAVTGALVTVTPLTGDSKTQMLTAGGSYLTGQAPFLYFGLRDSEGAVRVDIDWPDGQRTTRENVIPGRWLDLIAPERP